MSANNAVLPYGYKGEKKRWLVLIIQTGVV